MARWEAAAKAPETSLANVAPLGSAIGALSISGEKPVLVYDDGRMTEAARVWFIL
jgi:thiosulfate/3-mercaptopyruvate sulfurtransferase